MPSEYSPGSISKALLSLDLFFPFADALPGFLALASAGLAARINAGPLLAFGAGKERSWCSCRA